MAELKYKSSDGTWKTIVIKGDGIKKETDPVFSASPAASITETKMAEWDAKQGKITDLDTIRSGAAKGATALQSVPDEYVTKTELNNKGYATISDLNNKADKNNYTKFSTEETRIGTWIDGKPIYRKTIVYTCEDLTKTKFWAYYPSDTNGTEISAMNIDSYIGMSGVTFCANQAVPAGAWQPIPRVCPDANEAYNIGFGDLKPTRVGVLFGNKYLSATVYLTIEYTKTTD